SAVPANTTGEHQHLTHTDAPPQHITAGPPELFHLPAHTLPHQHDSHAQHDSDVEDGDRYGDLFSDEGADTPAGSQSTP
ncbi:hypothetical protein ACLQ24_30710, partial [Micromonospora sp. DT4]|uniref:hypothetical protein n=1 Tax=Micromonospora sp. DT4 TaxID=3393438 RepID=UPI003CE8A1BF